MYQTLRHIPYYLLLLLFLCMSCDSNQLTQAEKNWLAQQDSIKIAVYPYYPPYQFLTKNDSINGILPDYLTLIEKKLCYTFKKKQYIDWQLLLKDAKAERIDMVLEMEETTQRLQFMKFHSKLFQSSLVVVSRKDNEIPTSLHKFKNQTIAMVEGYSFYDRITEKYPHIKIIKYKNSILCLRSVQNGTTDAYIDTKAMAHYLIGQEQLNTLEITYDIPLKYAPSIAVSKSNDTLNNIIHKTIDRITYGEKKRIFDNWLFDIVKPFYKRPKFWMLFFLVSISIIAVIALLNFYLKFKVQQRTRELQVAKDLAEESNQVKTNFIQNISHEIRTPMNGIIGFSELLKNNSLSNQEKKDYAQIIIDSSKELIASVDDILEISKLETSNIDTVPIATNISELLQNIVELFTLKASAKGLDLLLNNKITDVQKHIITDQAKLLRILNNFIDNSVKFTYQGTITITSYIEDSYIVIMITDTGIGIKPKDQEKIFQNFSQSEKEISKNFGGLGLGLAIAKKNIDLMSGKVSFSSQENKGSSFTIQIPYHPMQQETTTYIEKDKKTKKHIVLIAEDGNINFLLLKTVLEKMVDYEFTIYRASNGQEAVSLCKENDTIDIVLMDIKMPIMDGYDATKEIKKIRPELPVVAQTAYSTQEDIEKALAAGCDDFIAKPVDRKILTPILNKYFSVFRKN